MSDAREVLIEKYAHNPQQIAEDLLSRPISDPLLRHFVYSGVTHVLTAIRHRHRTLVKKGRADEIASGQSRKFAIEAVEAFNKIDDEGLHRLGNSLNDILAQHTNSVLSKWVIAGVQLGRVTPELLLVEADAEDRSATGHAKNAVFYRELARRGAPGTPLAMTISADAADALCSSIFEDGLVP